jgi:hypothetical protein
MVFKVIKEVRGSGVQKAPKALVVLKGNVANKEKEVLKVLKDSKEKLVNRDPKVNKAT